MPHGFKKYLNEHNYKDRTIEAHVKEVENFFAFLDNHHNKTKELFQIVPADIKSYLENQLQTLKHTTVYKKLGILKLFFHHLWESGQIGPDPCVKIQLPKQEKEYNSLLTHQMLYDIQSNIYNSHKYPTRLKLAFIFALYGFKSNELYFLKEDFDIVNDNEVIINTGKRDVHIKEIAAQILIEFYNSQSLFAETPYFLFSKTIVDKNIIYDRISYITINRHLGKIANDFKLPPLNLTKARYSYIYHLAYKEKLSFEEISEKLGISIIRIGEIFENTKETGYSSRNSMTTS